MELWQIYWRKSDRNFSGVIMSMHCLKQDCGKLENELRNLEQMQYHLKDLVDDAQQNEKVKRR